MRTLNEIERGQICTSTIQCLHEIDGSLSNFPGLLKLIIRNRAWERRVDHGHVIELGSLRELITLKPLKGWNESIEAVKRAIRDDAEALSMLDAELQGKPGRPEQAEETLYNVQDLAPTGNAQVAGLRRLRTQRPDLHDEVVAGKLSTHAAMVKAGFRRKTVTVPVDDCDTALKALLKHFTREEIVAAIELM